MNISDCISSTGKLEIHRVKYIGLNTNPELETLAFDNIHHLWFKVYHYSLASD